MTVWVVKGGRVGEMEEFALQQGVAVVDFGLERSVTDFADRAALHDQVPASAANQLWRFAHEMREGDMPRSNFDQDLLFSMGAAQTVSQPRAGDAEDRAFDSNLDEQIQDRIVGQIQRKFTGN